MKIHDNRHLDFSNVVEDGDLVIAEYGEYQFITDEDRVNVPVIQIETGAFKAVDAYPFSAYRNLAVGVCMEVGGKIKEIVKQKDLILEIRK